MKKSGLKEYFQIFKYVQPNRLVYFIVLTGDCLTEVGLFLLIPFVMKLMIDAAVKANMHMLVSSIYLTLIVSILGMIIFFVVGFFLSTSFEKTTANIRVKLFSTIINLPVSYIDQNHSGDTISRLTNDIEAMRNAYSWPLRQLLVTFLMGLGSGLIMLLIDWRISIILLAIGFLSILINITQTRTLKGLNDTIQKNTGKYTENLSNMVGGFMTIKSLGHGKSMFNSAEEINQKICDGNLEIYKRGAFIDARNFFFSSINFLGVVIIASYLALNGVERLGSILSIVILLVYVNRMFSEINNMLLQLQGYIAGSSRVIELMESQTESEKINLEAINGSKAVIEMRDIVFSYDKENTVLNGVSLTINEGQIAALVGPSGGGKSTIIKLIMGFYTPSSGQMTICGKSLKSIKLAELRSMIAYVPQDSYMFDGTIEENIKYGNANATKQEIISAAELAYADKFIQELEHGYDTPVGERGIKLSGGQRQRISIARAFLKNAPILLLDEATSSLDSESEKYVQKALKMLMKNRTTLIIAHRLSTIEHSDIICLVDNGRIIESGTHADLLTDGNMYRRLYELQFNLD